MLDNPPQMSFEEFDRLMPDARARLMLRHALKVDPHDEGVDLEISGMRKAQMVRYAAFSLIDELSDEERDALRALVHAGFKIEEEMSGPQPGCYVLTQDVLWLFDQAFGNNRGYAWTEAANFDLSRDLLEKLEPQHT